MSAEFVASFKGTCAECDEEFYPGTLVRYEGRYAIIHSVCPPKKDVCQKCHIAHAGECW